MVALKELNAKWGELARRTQQPRRSKRARNQPERYGYSSKNFVCFGGLSSIGEDAKNVEEALNCLESVEGIKAMNEEMNLQNKTKHGY